MTKRFSGFAGVVSLTLLCSACGGGGSGDGGAVAALSVPTANGAASSSTAADAPASGAATNTGSSAEIPVGDGAQGVDKAPTTPLVAQTISGTVGVSTFLKSAATTIASFDGGAADSLGDWTYADSAVPAAYKGALISTLGATGGLGGGITFDLGCGASKWIMQSGAACGTVAFIRTRFKVPMEVSATPAISFDIRNPGATGLAELSLTDSTDQVLQYRFDPRTIERPSGSDWSGFHIPLTKTVNFYGGSNDGVLHGPIKGMAMAIGQSGVMTPVDQMSIDNLKLQAGSDFVYLLDPAAALVRGTFYPSYVGRLAVSAHPFNTASFAKAKEVGITIIRRDLKWADIESRGTYDFSVYDVLPNRLRDLGMSVLWVLDYGHPDHGGATPLTDPDRAAFAAFAGASAGHYQGRNVIGFEVWNEPNYPEFWPVPDADAYGALLSVTADAIKSADPAAKVVSGGVSVSGIKQLTYLARLAQTGALRKVDAVAVHPYRATKPESFAADMAPIRNLLDSNDVSAPVWVSEWGYGARGYFDSAVYGDGWDPRALQRQAVLTVRQVLTQLAMDLPVITLYDLVDDGADPTNREFNMGLMKPDLTDKPAMTALRTLFSVAGSRTFKGPLSHVPPVMHAMRWDGANDKVFAIWVDTAGATSSIAFPVNTLSVIRWDGSAVSFTRSPTETSVTLTDADGPVFVTVGH